MDALQVAYLTLDILASPYEQQLQGRQVAQGNTGRHSNAPPSLPSIRETEKEGTDGSKVPTTRIFKDGGGKATSSEIKLLPLTKAPSRNNSFLIGAWRHDDSEENKKESTVSGG